MMRGFIDKLLELIHLQWIIRNTTKYHHTNRMIKPDAKHDVMISIEGQLNMGLASPLISSVSLRLIHL